MVLKVLLLSACLAHWLPAVIGGGPYFLVAERKAWQEAQDYCRSRYTDLASIKSQVDLDLLAAVAGYIDAWIGLSVNSNGHWTWSDGGSLNFTNWSRGQPSQRPSCVRVQSLSWYTADCANQYIFICFGGPRATTTVPQPPSASTEADHVSVLLNEVGYIDSEPFERIPKSFTSAFSGVKNIATFSSVGIIDTSSLVIFNPTASPTMGVTNTNFSALPGTMEMQLSTEQQRENGLVIIQNSASSPTYRVTTQASFPFRRTSNQVSPTSSQPENSSPAASLPNGIFSPPAGLTNPASYPNNTSGSLIPTSMTVKKDSVQSLAENDAPTVFSSVPSNAASQTPASGTTSPRKVLKFHLNLDLKSWNEARTHCRSEHTDLASVPDTDVHTVITALLAESGSTSPGAWLGLRRNRFQGNWYWVNDQSFDFNYWSEGEPSNRSWEKCGMVSAEHGRNFSWADECCGTKLLSICYSES